MLLCWMNELNWIRKQKRCHSFLSMRSRNIWMNHIVVSSHRHHINFQFGKNKFLNFAINLCRCAAARCISSPPYSILFEIFQIINLIFCAAIIIRRSSSNCKCIHLSQWDWRENSVNKCEWRQQSAVTLTALTTATTTGAAKAAAAEKCTHTTHARHHGFDEHFFILSDFVGDRCGAYDTCAILCVR